MNLQHTKTRNRLEPKCVEKLLYIQINQRQFRADLPPLITQEMLLEEEDEEIETILQRRHVQDSLSAAFEDLDSTANSLMNSATNFTAPTVRPTIPPTVRPTVSSPVPPTALPVVPLPVPPPVPSINAPIARPTVPIVPAARPILPKIPTFSTAPAAPLTVRPTAHPTLPTLPTVPSSYRLHNSDDSSKFHCESFYNYNRDRDK